MLALVVFIWRLLEVQCFLQYSLYVKLWKVCQGSRCRTASSLKCYLLRDLVEALREASCTPTEGLMMPRSLDTCLATWRVPDLGPSLQGRGGTVADLLPLEAACAMASKL